MKIGIITPDPLDGCSFYRAFGTLPLLARAKGHIITFAAQWSWPTIVSCDAMFMHAPHTTDHVAVANMCRQLNVPLWVDFDDNVFAMPISNPSHDAYMDSGTQANIRKTVGLASAITVSTEALSCEFPGSTVVRNAHNDYVWPVWSSEQSTPTPTVTWRGGHAHLRDWDPYVQAMWDNHNRKPDWQFVLFGYMHWKLAEIGRHVPFGGLLSYMESLRAVAPSIHVVPLVNDPFNRCKSNAAWLEATRAGAAVLAPNWPEWQKPGITNYETPEDFRTQLGFLMDSSPESLQALVADSKAHIQVHLCLSVVNETREKILQAIRR